MLNLEVLKNFAPIVAGLIFFYALVKLLIHLCYKLEQKKWKSLNKDVVVLHQIPLWNSPMSLSPFVIKLETFLRMNQISYVSDTKFFTSSKGKTPWITINGKDIADSQLCIEYLNQHFGIDMSSHLSDEERAVARSMRIMVEDHLFWWGVIEKVGYR